MAEGFRLESMNDEGAADRDPVVEAYKQDIDRTLTNFASLLTLLGIHKVEFKQLVVRPQSLMGQRGLRRIWISFMIAA